MGSLCGKFFSIHHILIYITCWEIPISIQYPFLRFIQGYKIENPIIFDSMITVDNILKLGDPRLYENCEPLTKGELPQVMVWVKDLHEAMQDIRKR